MHTSTTNAEDVVLNHVKQQVLQFAAFRMMVYKEKLCQLFISSLQLTHSYWSKQRATAYSIQNRVTQQKPQGSLTQPSILRKIH